jgi:hypothetical protein
VLATVSSEDRGSTWSRRSRILRAWRTASWAERVVGVAFGLWALAPLAVLFVHTSGGLGLGSGGRFFTGVDRPDVPDQLQYLAWIRDSGEHLLLANQFDLRSDPHLFLHPVFALSGLAWRLGLSLQLSLLAWKPIWALALLLGFGAYVRRLVDAPLARAGALALALFTLTPAVPLIDWLGLGGPALQFGTQVVGFEMFAGNYLAGAAALSVAAMPVYLLGLERLLDGPAAGSRRAGRGLERLLDGPAAGSRRAGRGTVAWTSLAGLTASWLHPWQGLTLLVLSAAIVVWGRHWARVRTLVVPVGATLAPIAYYFVLSRLPSSWHTVAHPNGFHHFGSWLWVALAPVVLAALPGLPGRGLDTQQRLLRLWPVCAAVVYLALQTSWFFHAFVGLSLPLAILTVNGWRALGLGRRALGLGRRGAVALAAVAVLALTVPGSLYYLQRTEEESALHFLAADEGRALRYLATQPGPGGVLARGTLATAVPAYSGRGTWAGHPTWTPEYPARSAQADALFAGRLSPTRARALVTATGAGFVLADCHAAPSLATQLGAAVSAPRRFGCAAVYRVLAPGPLP